MPLDRWYRECLYIRRSAVRSSSIDFVRPCGEMSTSSGRVKLRELGDFNGGKEGLRVARGGRVRAWSRAQRSRGMRRGMRAAPPPLPLAPFLLSAITHPRPDSLSFDRNEYRGLQPIYVLYLESIAPRRAQCGHCSASRHRNGDNWEVHVLPARKAKPGPSLDNDIQSLSRRWTTRAIRHFSSASSS